MPSFLAFTLLSSLALFAAPLVAQDAGGAFFKDMNLYGADGPVDFGSRVAYLGDVNADSVGDFLIAIPLYDSLTTTASGAVQLISGADGSLIFQFEGTANYELFGSEILALPDIDGDSVADLAIASQAGDGQVHLYSGQTQILLRTIAAPVDAHGFGVALAVLQDVDANTTPEILIGSEDAVVGGLAVGCAFMFDTATGTQIQSVCGTAVGDSFGRSLASIDDVNSDGVQDYLVASPGNDPAGITNAGSVFLYSGIDGTQLLQIDGTLPSLWLGSSLLGLEDINGDLVPDFAIGTIRDTSGLGLFVGSVSLCSGADGSLIRKYYGKDSYEQFGECLATMPDMDGDGVTDFLVGAPGDLFGGRVYVYSANIDGLLQMIESETFDDQFGSSAVSMGDYDGDGDFDVLAGAPRAEDLVTDGGGVYICGLRPGIIASSPTVSDSAGGTVIYDLAFPTDFIGNPVLQYQVLASGTGTDSQNVFGVLAPLVADALYNDTLGKRYPGAITTPFGNLAPDGTGQFTVGFPAGGATNLVGNIYYLSVAWFETGSAGFILHGFSKAVSLEIIP
jgi:VCBS repeat protein/FG-GAP repeat protein